MAIIKSGTTEVEIPDGSEVREACESLGVPFGCSNGMCGACLTVIKSGLENLSEQTEREKSMGLTLEERLMCQCRILQGEVDVEVF